MPEGTELELPEDAVFTEAAEQDGANQLGDVVLEEAGFDVEEDDQLMETEIQEAANVTEGKERQAIKKKLGKASVFVSPPTMSRNSAMLKVPLTSLSSLCSMSQNADMLNDTTCFPLPSVALPPQNVMQILFVFDFLNP
ncbi:hypothetical protein DY000_02033273 [Brassica cretica]|uniref:Uncharacterized protein n=1 Tax=Brassica cretica TaxID=69181 RepID=A0ABQ7DQN0_BRACR|nr:hypothetical protein DY000_02033273 [Brassica cretica]